MLPNFSHNSNLRRYTMGINQDFPVWAIFATAIPALGLTLLVGPAGICWHYCWHNRQIENSQHMPGILGIFEGIWGN
jgi:hypothetical protein